ncbi:DUF4839 domain-containing protein [Micromonospora sp. WMMA1949]|uniref:DUF4839 domain-containing protein n=1 Tax=Micromonospora sp. WMMA1949 TaxID=3015162 RepID=UPI0022B64A44|nr:DUF4839 domain-containing protein [Micromonospora sp. WMMA1949]MCZ7430049.1 DUF4839 domain-containing protein [Micromonospora sp. WMMA1949]
MRKMAALVVPVLALLVGCEVPEAASTDAGTEKAKATVTAKAKATAPKTITVENNPDFAALLAGPPHGKTVEAAVEKFLSKTVEFDGFVSDIYINPREHLGASTIDVMAGDASDKKHTGPVFQLSWYGHEDPMEKLAKGTNVHVKASAGVMYEFEPFQYYLIDEDSNDSESPLTAR